jgi:predicted ATPase
MNNWYVITGAFSSGKSTLLRELAARGHRTVPEAARVLIDQEMALGKALAEIRGDEAAFQRQVLAMKIQTEASLPPGDTIFFDRGIPDSVAYLELGGFDAAGAREASRGRVYRRVFILDPLPFQADYARTEAREQAAVLDRLLEKCYLELGCPVTRIPVASVDERVARVLGAL